MFFKSLLLGLMFIIAVVAGIIFGTPYLAEMGLMPGYVSTSPSDQGEPNSETTKPKARWLRQVLENREKIAQEERADSIASAPQNSPEDMRGSTYAGYDGFENAKQNGESKTTKSTTTTTTVIVSDENNVAKSQPARGTFETLMREVENIEREDLHDQAYFEIVNFAIYNGLFEEALRAHGKISQTELAYTARGQIAVAYAKNGQAELAFATIDKVADAQLRDFMRLQVIESMTAPHIRAENPLNIK